MIGRVQHLAVWYWNLRNDPTIHDYQKPDSGPDTLGEVAYFDGGLSIEVPSCYPSDLCGLPAPSNQPTLYYAVGTEPPPSSDPASEDTSLAVEGGERKSKSTTNSL